MISLIYFQVKRQDASLAQGLQMFVFPANRNAKQPAVFVKYAKIADNPVILSSEEITANREKWIEDWTDIVLR